MINPLRRQPFRSRRSVGLVGLFYSGKTVLLTSLIAHLRNHDPDRLPLSPSGDPVELTHLGELPPNLCADRFDFDDHYNRLIESDWPAKTDRLNEYRAEYVIGRDSWWTTDLALVDLPGERLADMVIALHPDFEGWSDAVLGVFRNQAEFASIARPYLAAVEQSSDESAILASYRTVLATLHTRFMPFISPSSFVLSPEGMALDARLDAPAPASIDDRIRQKAERGLCGLTALEQFAPLPPSARQRLPGLASLFSDRYKRYRERLVLPFARALGRCDDLVVLVDVTVLLEGGHGMVNAYRAFLEQVLIYVDPGLSPGRQLFASAVSMLSLGFSRLEHVRRVAFVATKADRVVREDRDTLLDLLSQLTRPIIRPHQVRKDLTVEHLIVAAVRSTWSDPGDPADVLRYNTPRGEVRAAVSRLPDDWPDQFDPGRFRFPRPEPSLPRARVKVPPHINLDRLARFVLGLRAGS
jgi:predicted YcjX-like family ATPase